MSIPRLIIGNIKKFTKFPGLSRSVCGTARKVVGVLGAMAVKDAPMKPMSEVGYGKTVAESMVGQADESEMGEDFAKTKNGITPKVEFDEKALESAGAAAEAEDAEEVDPAEAELTAKAEKEMEEAEKKGDAAAPQAAGMARI
jgi:hypothetical protein